MLKKHGFERDAETVNWDAKRITEIHDIVKEHLELKAFLKNLVK